MKFGEKIKTLRKEQKLSQADLAKAVGLSARAVQNYEIAGSYPKNREMYKKLAEVLKVDVNYLLTDDEEFISAAQEKYGRRGAKDAERLVSQITGLFAGGEITEDTKDEVMQAIQNAYWAAKKENQKYTPKKYRKQEIEWFSLIWYLQMEVHNVSTNYIYNNVQSRVRKSKTRNPFVIAEDNGIMLLFDANLKNLKGMYHCITSLSRHKSYVGVYAAQ